MGFELKSSLREKLSSQDLFYGQVNHRESNGEQKWRRQLPLNEPNWYSPAMVSDISTGVSLKEP
jgi:hypothetical protein